MGLGDGYMDICVSDVLAFRTSHPLALLFCLMQHFDNIYASCSRPIFILISTSKRHLLSCKSIIFYALLKVASESRNR